MEPIYKLDKVKIIDKPEDITFITKISGIYIIQISAKTKDEKHLNGTDDEDLKVEIDKAGFPHLKNPERYLDSPASFSGGTLKGLEKTIYFILRLDPGKHTLSLVPDISATITSINISKISEDLNLENLKLSVDNQADDGDRRPWITFVLFDIACKKFFMELKLTRRFMDSDDIKVIVNGEVKRSNRSMFRKLWYFISSIIYGEIQKEEFVVDLSSGLHYIEFWADRKPTFNSITFFDLAAKIIEESIQDKIRRFAKQYDLDPELMIKIAKKESQFDPKATSPANAKGIFQLTDITIKQIEILGFKIKDPYDVDQNITGGTIYFKWLSDRYLGDPEHLEKTLAAWNWGLNNFPKKGPLDYTQMPNETKNFIKDILQK